MQVKPSFCGQSFTVSSRFGPHSTAETHACSVCNLTRRIQSCLNRLCWEWKVPYVVLAELCGEVPGLQEGEQPLLQDVEDRGEEEGQGQEDEQLVGELPAVVLGDEFSSQLNGPCHGLELVICLLDRS